LKGAGVPLEKFVTEWGYPLLRWDDLIGDMTGNPHTDHMPRIKVQPVQRQLWIGPDGKQVIALDKGRDAVAGHWPNLQAVVLGSSRDDLTPQDVVNLERRRLRWVEHQTLTAHFSDGITNRIAQSAVPVGTMKPIHDAIVRAFIEERPSGPIPAPVGRGLPERLIVPPVIENLEVGEESLSQWDAAAPISKLCGFKHDPNVASFDWLEPVVSQGWLGKKHHLVQRHLYVGKGFTPERRWLSFNSYSKDGRAFSVNMPLDMLEGFELLEGNQFSVPKSYHPAPSMLPGRVLLARFKCGYQVPLTCTHGEEVAGLLMHFEREFLPLVGRPLSDREITPDPSNWIKAEGTPGNPDSRNRLY
jgi:hypothetical protein